MELKFVEKFILISLRVYYKFFANNNYEISRLSYCSRDGEIIEFQSKDSKIKLQISYENIYENIYENRYYFDIALWKKGPSPYFDNRSIFLSKILEFFPDYANTTPYITNDNMQKKMMLYLEFVERYLLPIIQGKMWINEVLKNEGIEVQRKR